MLKKWKKNKDAILGEYILDFEESTNTVSVYFKTKLIRPIGDIGEFLDVFRILGFLIQKIDEKNIEVILPNRWLHLQSLEITNETFIIDDKGRLRIRIFKNEKSYALLRRFDCGVDFASGESAEGKISIATIYVTDNFIRLDEYKFDIDAEEFRKELINEMNVIDIDDETLYELIKDRANSYLTEMVPEWRNPLLFWDD